MAKKAGKGASMGFKSVSTGGKADGARTSKKKQVTALLPQNKIAAGRKARMAKMEKQDGPV